LQFTRTYLLVCLADHNLPHPLPIPPLEGEGIFKLALMPLKGEGRPCIPPAEIGGILAYFDNLGYWSMSPLPEKGRTSLTLPKN